MRAHPTMLWAVLSVALPACARSEAQQPAAPARGTGQRTMTVEQAATFLRLRLPASAKEVQVYTEDGADRMVALRATFPRAELPAFLAAAGYEGKVRGNIPPALRRDTIKGVPWWTPEQAKKYLTGTLHTPTWASRLLVDTTADERVVVFVQAFTL